MKEQYPIYEALLKVVAKHLKPGFVEQLMHEFDSQKNEAMNSSIAKVAPKDLTLSTTKSLSFRIAIAIGIDSIGWNGYVAKVVASLNPVVATDHLFAEFLGRKQKRKRYWQVRQARMDIRLKRKQDVNDKIKKTKVDDDRAINEGITYGPGLAMLLEEEENRGTQDGNNNESGNGKDGKKGAFCKACKKTGHSKTSSKQCLFYRPRRPMTKTQNTT
jgi:hypothetical protein